MQVAWGGQKKLFYLIVYEIESQVLVIADCEITKKLLRFLF